MQYTFTICNTGNIALNRVTVLDDVLGNLTAAFPATLAPDQCATVSQPFVVPAGSPNPLVNTVTATYADILADVHSTVTHTASASLALFTPSVQIVKSGPQFSKVGDTVTYSFTITNTSSANSPPLVLDSITDTLLGNLATQAGNALCGTLPPGGVCTFTVDRTVLATDPNPLVNTVTVHYHPQGFPNDVTASDSHSVTLANASFTLTKICQSGMVPAGGTAVFRVTVTNNGNVPLNFTTSESAPFSLAPGGVNTFTVNVPVPPNTPGNCQTQVSNTISVTATIPPEFGLDNTILKTATAVCPVITFGRTRGFWGNQGHSILDPDNNGILNTPVTLGGNGRVINVTTIAQSDTLLAGNFCPTPSSCTLSMNLQRGTLNTLVAQTLALQYNILFITCYAGQTIAQLGCTANLTSDLTALGLSGSSTVQQVLALANSLIGNSAAGGTTTQQQAGPMNSLLGCLNREM